MNIIILIEMRDWHQAKVEEICNRYRNRHNYGDQTFEERVALNMHERFVTELSHAIAETK